MNSSLAHTRALSTRHWAAGQQGDTPPATRAPCPAPRPALPGALGEAEPAATLLQSMYNLQKKCATCYTLVLMLAAHSLILILILPKYAGLAGYYRSSLLERIIQFKSSNIGQPHSLPTCPFSMFHPWGNCLYYTHIPPAAHLSSSNDEHPSQHQSTQKTMTPTAASNQNLDLSVCIRIDNCHIKTKRLNERRSNGGLSRGRADLNCGCMTGRSGPCRTKSEGAPHGLETGAIALAIAGCLACLPSHAHTAQHI
jgi:hypothetical protein